MPILLAALLACLMLSTTVAAQEAPPADLGERVGLLFQIGMHDAGRGRAGRQRRGARETLRQGHCRLPDNPGQPARVHTGAPGTGANVLPQGPGRAGAAPFRAGAGWRGAAAGRRSTFIPFLNIMRARKRWTGYFGGAIAPDSNLNAASESEIIYIDTVFGRLPFQREGDFGAQSGFGVSVWGGGEYQQPLSERLRLRVGADLAVREYPAQRLRPDLPGRPRRAALAGEPDYRAQLAGYRSAAVAGQHTVRGRDRACAWNLTAG